MIDLNAPLGMAPPPRRRRLPVLLAGGCLAAAAALGLVLAFADPHGGEPYAVAVLPPIVAPPPAAAAPPAPPPMPQPAEPPAPPAPPATRPSTDAAGANPAAGAAAFDAGTMENGVRVFRGTAPPAMAAKSAAAGPLLIDVSRQLGLPPRPDPARADARASAPPSSPAPAPRSVPAARPGAEPRIALFIGNMGLSRAATEQAIAAMPAEVALAFLPYGGRLQGDVAAARARGHEVLLQVPMENAGAPPPGPHALRAGESALDLAGDLDWIVGRVKGYDGLSNLLGAAVTAEPAAMDALAKAAAARGLFLAGDGTDPRSAMADAAGRANVPAVAADVLLDATADPATVRRNLDRLVAAARRNGQAIGVASGLPEHLALIAGFAAELRAQSIKLVPLGTLARRTATVATMTR